MFSKLRLKPVTQICSTLQATLLSSEDDGLQELIGVLIPALSVDVLNGLDGVLRFGTLAQNHTLQGPVRIVSATGLSR